MNSFYGGKQGRTYHIVERYDCVSAAAFKIDYEINRQKRDHDDTFEVPNLTSIENNTAQMKSAINALNKGDLFIYNQYYLLLDTYGSETNNIYDLINNTKKTYAIQGMVQNFSKGGSYSKVNYGQYVIIDTIRNLNHKSDLENGLLFRRGFDYNSADLVSLSKPVISSEEFYDEENNFNKQAWQAAWSNWLSNVGGGAIYVGQIVGPEGNAPQLEPVSWEVFNDNTSGLITDRHIINPVSETVGFKWEEGNPVYDDTVKFGTATIKDSDGNITGAYIAFDIPMHTIVVSGQSVDPYGHTARNHLDEASEQTDSNIKITVETDTGDNSGKITGYKDLIHLHSETGKDANHPFYYNYDIAIPKGIHGTDLSHIIQKKGSEIGLGSLENPTKDSQGNNLIADDEYITFSLTDYNYKTGDEDDPNLGKTTNNHGRLPYRVINQIKQELFNRNYIDLDSESASIQIGQIYENENNLYAICIKQGTVPDSLKIWLENPARKVGDTSAKDTTGEVSRWRFIEFNRSPAAGLQIDYKAGESDFIATNLIDYLYLDDYGYLHAIYNQYDNNKDTKEERVRNNQDIILGFVDSIDSITQDDGLFTIRYKENNRKQTFFANYIIDIQRYGANLYALYSNDFKRKEYADNHTYGTDWRYFPYTFIKEDGTYDGINLTGRIATGQSDAPQGYIYIKIDTTVPNTAYAIHGNYELKHLVWVAERTDEDNYFNNVRYTGILADLDHQVWEKGRFLDKLTNPESDSTANPEKYMPEYREGGEGQPEYVPQTVLNTNQEGRLVTISHSQQKSGNTAAVVGSAVVGSAVVGESENTNEAVLTTDFYAYNFNKHRTPQIYQLSQIGLTEYESEEIDLVAYSYWYKVQSINQASVRPSSIFIIDTVSYDEEENEIPAHTHHLNEDGLWFVLSTGHDQL